MATEMAQPVGFTDVKAEAGDHASPNSAESKGETLKHRVLAAFDEVTNQQNLGKFLWETHGCDEGKQLQFAKAMADIFAIPEVAAKLPQSCGPVLKTVPASARSNAYLHPWHLSLCENAKAGRFPTMHQTRLHMPSIVWKHYQAHREALEIKCDAPAGDQIGHFTVRYIDGHNKGMMVQGLLAMVIHTGMRHDEIAADDDFCQLLTSLKYLRVNYQPLSAQAALYETLCLAHSTSEKQKPGPLDLALLFREVLEVKKHSGTGSSTREVLFASIAEYNKCCTSKAWRINEATRRLLYGVLRCPASFLEVLKRATEYCAWKDSAFTLENLDGDWFVPGNLLGGSAVTDQFWKQVKTVTAEKVHLWAERAWKDHIRKAPRDSAVKQKKAAQRSLTEMQDLLETCCLWTHIEGDLISYIGKGSEYDRVAGMWEQGTLDAELKSHCRGMAPDFDFRKMSFVVEASGSLHNEQLEQAQSRTANALKKSLGAAWELFQTNLQSDQVMRDKFLNSCSGDESRQRAAIIDSLEKMHAIAWKQVNAFIMDTVPTWCNSATAKQKEHASASPEQETDTSAVLTANLMPWLENSLASMSGGIRRLDQELVVVFVNFQAAGVVSANRQHFVLTQVTALCNSFPRSCVAVLVMPNRAADLRNAKAEVKDEAEAKAEQEDGDEAGQDDGNDDDEEICDAGKDDSDALLRDFQYQVKCQYMERARNLRVRSAVVNFDPDTVYGSRTGFQEVLLVMAREKNSVPAKSKFVKSGCVSGAKMLPRAEMVKLPRDAYGGEAKFTPVQELKQHAGGASFVATVMDGLLPPASAGKVAPVILDLMGYDAAAATYTVNKVAAGAKIACATVAHTKSETSFCTALIANKVFDLSRAQRLSIPGFPDFKKTVQELKTTAQPPHPDYSVTIPVADSLVIKEALIDHWTTKPDFKADIEKAVKEHNAVYNKRGLKRGSDASGGDQATRPTKKLCIEADPISVDEFETKYPDRLDLASGHWTLSLAGGSLFIHSQEDFVLDQFLELFSFGSGDYVSKSEATDVLSDLEGRWIRYDLTGRADERHVILETNKKLPEHLSELDIFNKVIPLSQLMRSLEDAGEVNLSLAEHEVQKTEAGLALKVLHDVCFVLDPQNGKKRKKVSAITFGRDVNFTKLRASKNVQILWRLRIHTDKGSARELVPVRPVAVLPGSISLKSKRAIQLA